MYENIFRNLPGSPNWEGSFYEQLAEFGKWDPDEFWKLHLDLISAAQIEAQSEAVDRALALAVVTLYSNISSLILANFNSNDGFEIANLSRDELRAFMERLEHAVHGVFSGEIIPERSYDLTNPLIVGL
ncbi:Imm41 family immunity protein [Herbaspirillum robiniae]|uniref:Uncharacterized protein n=1 Tax=Herbaspirillum robiniae TaxID=2014887 RepID=A0ABX2LXJ2_9BURK|nr:Imm41 family immunity protein [Herbaspirillum robiniae]NUU02826.1 hypothetical protein [Herbaspirillum robiniae]